MRMLCNNNSSVHVIRNIAMENNCTENNVAYAHFDKHALCYMNNHVCYNV